MIKSKALKLVFDSACWSKKIECNKLPPLPPVLRKRERKRERERGRERERLVYILFFGLADVHIS